MDFERFVLAQIPPQARILEVGCGAGDLALTLREDGFSVLAIDPEAPEGSIFRRTTLEALSEPGPFDGAVASYSLHHIEDLDVALDKLVSLLVPKGMLVIEDFGWDRVDRPTAEWYARQQDAPSAESVLAEWRDEHEELHPYEPMRRALDQDFAESFFEWRPYLYRCLGRNELEDPERDAIARSQIQAVGFRYVGLRR